VNKDLLRCIDQINKSYKREVVVKGESIPAMWKAPRLSTGCVALDADLGGGLVLNRLNQISGEFSTGKTMLCGMLAKNFQNNLITPAPDKGSDNVVVYIDLERTFDPSWFTTLGVDMSNFAICYPLFGEEAIDVSCDLLDAVRECHSRSLVFVDSITALRPLLDQDNDTSGKNQTIGSHSRIVSRAIIRFLPKLQKVVMNPTPENTVIFVNQVRVDIGKMIGDPDIETGGRSPRFFSSQIIRLRRGQDMKDKNGNSVGFDMRWTVKKDKTGGSEKKTGNTFVYTRPYDGNPVGFDNYSRVLSIGEDMGIINRGGSTYTLPNGKKISGKEKVITFLRSDEGSTTYDSIVHAIQGVVRKGGSTDDNPIEDEEEDFGVEEENKPESGKRPRKKTVWKGQNRKRCAPK